MTAINIVKQLLAGCRTTPANEQAQTFAPSNIALVKYWGKRDEALRLPVTPSLSLSLADRGTSSRITLIDSAHDKVSLNGKVIAADHPIMKRVVTFLDYFRFEHNYHYHLDTVNNIPVAAGVASSASAFAAVTQTLDQLFDWQLPRQQLSILARLGSGSACRSLWHGFVEWHCGHQSDGMDSYAQPLDAAWPELCIGLLFLDKEVKTVGSSEGMRLTQQSSPFYALWPQQVEQAMVTIKHAIAAKDFIALASCAEKNALAMHACMLTAEPALFYSRPATIAAMEQIWQLRRQGLALFFTQDAGANLKLLFLRQDYDKVATVFPTVELVQPFINGEYL
ncbi:MAG: diphosphomevalonate decarboxylase [Gammaproteobacteria bacterium]|nr:diphosphomevalonate decarboxylase [Gammaproteobacteria bacterium]MCP4474759.1 diphosphomevalonate decarboxylase [Gammaproteobacteria bacterium]